MYSMLLSLLFCFLCTPIYTMSSLSENEKILINNQKILQERLEAHERIFVDIKAQLEGGNEKIMNLSWHLFQLQLSVTKKAYDANFSKNLKNWMYIGIVLGIPLYQYFRSKYMIPSHVLTVIDPKNILETFDSVIGQEAAKKELAFFIQQTQDNVNIKASAKGILFEGLPGTGKTLLARALAKELNSCFLYVASAALEDKYIGETAKNVKTVFAYARSRARKGKVVLFFDEIDSIARKRVGGDHSWVNEGINQMLLEMDSIQKTANNNILVLGATNLASALDPAIVRPGRFDSIVTFTLPDFQERKQLFDLHLKNRICDSSVDVQALSQLTGGCSQADISGLVQAAYRESLSEKSKCITQNHFDYAIDVKYLGQAPVKKSVPDDFESLRYTAYHEAGHALMAYAFYKHAYIYKATIEQRGNALGFVKTIHHPHITTIHKGDMEAMVGMALGGRVAEKICFNMCSTGAHSDLQYATQLAYNMIAQYGMTDDIICSEMQSQAVVVPEEIKYRAVNAVLKVQEARVTAFLQKNRRALDVLAEALLERKTLRGGEIDALLKSVIVRD